ncbi:helix-turn-helix transcriptional regulator [Cellulomonas fengjieae]|uniref:YafY family transcriptional regulator n=1 Tax=Cellulomonas fengjieae TaxID=2819978 RepID=A0ABS3SKM9_9CELL|nr:YafY family protein [Cellulomonas fengjieae]MBO3086311.1 YafY family transcriptional regulator [Cellulomonas fengjieae]QVI65650.1 YafY family transcriptional regulator [Cellulomonas fengjieae]
MSNTSSRTLRLLSLLQARRFWSGSGLADELGVSPRTLRRDVDRLRELGYPVDSHPGVDGGYALAAGASLPPLVVDDDEAMALAVAIQSHLSTGEGGDAALRALSKVVQAMPRRLRARLDALRTSTTPAPWSPASVTPVDHSVLSTLALGCRDHERVRFAYVAASGASSSRLVEPAHLVALGWRWYLVGYDLDRHDWRTFRIDRIDTAQSAGTSFAPRTPPFDDVTAYVRARVLGDEHSGRHRVEVMVEASADQVRAHVGRWAQVRADSAGRCTLTMETDSLEGPLFALGSLGAEFTVVSPSALADVTRDWAARFTRAAQLSG